MLDVSPLCVRAFWRGTIPSRIMIPPTARGSDGAAVATTVSAGSADERMSRKKS